MILGVGGRGVRTSCSYFMWLAFDPRQGWNFILSEVKIKKNPCLFNARPDKVAFIPQPRKIHPADTSNGRKQ